MKTNILILSLIAFALSFNSCSNADSTTVAADVKGKEISGVWYSNNANGNMKLEIVPWKGKFRGYLLEYKSDKETIQGGKTKEHIFLTDLVFENNQYQNGKIYLDPTSKESCGITLDLINATQLEAKYNCSAYKETETWTRMGSKTNPKSKMTNMAATRRSQTGFVAESSQTNIRKKPVTQQVSKIDGRVKKKMEDGKVRTPAYESGNKLSEKSIKINERNSRANAQKSRITQNSGSNFQSEEDKKVDKNNNSIIAQKLALQNNNKLSKNGTARITTKSTTKKEPFFVVGSSRQVVSDNTNAIKQASENLWNEINEKKLSSRISNIEDNYSVYMVYSDYDKPKGKITITLGYKTSNLNNIPRNLKGVKIPANNYSVYPISGTESDYEGEAWNEMLKVRNARQAESADFEVYTFDKNYNVRDAKRYIGMK